MGAHHEHRLSGSHRQRDSLMRGTQKMETFQNHNRRISSTTSSQFYFSCFSITAFVPSCPLKKKEKKGKKTIETFLEVLGKYIMVTPLLIGGHCRIPGGPMFPGEVPSCPNSHLYSRCVYSPCPWGWGNSHTKASIRVTPAVPVSGEELKA